MADLKPSYWERRVYMLRAEVERLQYENKQLRAALQAMVDAWDMSTDEGQHRRIWDEARAALEAKP